MPSKVIAVNGTIRIRPARTAAQVQFPRPRARKPRYKTASRTSETPKFRSSGLHSLTPKSTYVSVINTGHRIELAQEVNPNDVTPHTPWRAKFLAIAMWM